MALGTDEQLDKEGMYKRNLLNGAGRMRFALWRRDMTTAGVSGGTVRRIVAR